MGSTDDNLDMPTHERIGSLITSQSKARALQERGEGGSEVGGAARVDISHAHAVIKHWPEAPKKAAEKLLDHYGAPHEMTYTKMFWYRIDRWARIELTADEILHNFPTPHTDYLTQYVDYPVPARAATDLVEFDGSVIVDRTAGQIGARCDHEAYNTLTLNLAVEIIEGRRTVEDARRFYGETAAAFALGRSAPYAEGLLFTPPSGETGDPDEPIIGKHMVHQTFEKVKDVLGVGDEPR